MELDNKSDQIIEFLKVAVPTLQKVKLKGYAEVNPTFEKDYSTLLELIDKVKNIDPALAKTPLSQMAALRLYQQVIVEMSKMQIE